MDWKCETKIYEMTIDYPKMCLAQNKHNKQIGI